MLGIGGATQKTVAVPPQPFRAKGAGRLVSFRARPLILTESPALYWWRWQLEKVESESFRFPLPRGLFTIFRAKPMSHKLARGGSSGRGRRVDG